MSSTIEELEAKIRSLTPEEKTALLRSLIAEIDGPPRPEIEREWIETAKRRHREIAEGGVKGIPADRVFEKVQSQLKR